ncbi:hypothetical protein Syun_011354 [Stephania yunnanensis]|uniref:Uncharacterized protein n=1 Tax=Stephania yunnanensis TaxID=152371 RepID=A0AAP0PGD8_9MAGN
MAMAMKRLSRKQWRTSRGEDDDEYDRFSLPTHDDSRPIDTHEQEELIRMFEQKQCQQSFLWRSIFATILFCFMAFLIFSIYHQASYPWELSIGSKQRYHAYFMDEVASWIVISADWVAVLACLMAVKGLLLHSSKHHRKWILYSCCAGLSLTVFWLYHMIRLPRFRWDIIWLPFGPISGAGICLYVDHLLAESSGEIRKLRGYMYSFKAS